MVWVHLRDMLGNGGVPTRDSVGVASVRVRDSGITPCVICDFPREDRNIVHVAGNNLGGVILECIDKRLIDVELVMLLRFGKLSYVGVHPTPLVTQEVPNNSRVGSVVPSLHKAHGISGCVIRLGVPIVGKRQDEEQAMFLGELNNRVELRKAVRTIIDFEGTVAVDELEPSADLWNGSDIIKRPNADRVKAGLR